MSSTTAPKPQDELDGMPEPVEHVARIEGKTVDKIELGFTGRLALDINDEADADLYNALALGRTVYFSMTVENHDIELEGTVVGTPHGITLDAEGWEKNLTGRRRIRIHSGDRPARPDSDEE